MRIAVLIDNGISHVRAVQHSLAYERTLAAHAAAREPTPRYTQPRSPERDHPKPIYSYSCLIALALKNSHNMCLTVAEIYAFMCENFPYFRTAPAGWKNSVRHNLSLNKCFEKIVHDAPGGHGRKVSALSAHLLFYLRTDCIFPILLCRVASGQ